MSPVDASLSKAPDFLAGGGEMGALIRAHDWASSPVGLPETWPQGLRVTIRLMLNSQHPMFIWWGADLIQFYNDAYRQTMGPEMHPAALGARGRDSWADIWPIIGPQIELVMEGKGATWNVDQMVPIRRHGARQEVWWTYGFSPIDLEDRVGGVLVVCNDVTEQHLATEALKDEGRRRAAQFEAAPGFIAVLRGPDHIFELTNASYRQLIGGRDVIGKSIREALPDISGQGFYELLDEVYTTGKSFVGRRTPLHLQADPNHPPVLSYVDFVYQPIVEVDGRASGIFVEGQDVTDHVEAEKRLELINNELKHRVKNTLAMVSAIATQTFRTGSGPDAIKVFQDRLSAFGAAHDILTADKNAVAPIRQVIEEALAPHRGTQDRFYLDGPLLLLNSKQTLSLALAMHELATNAAKYGALSSEHGSVDVSWSTGGGRFHLRWAETGGPPVTRPTRTGFGSRLIKGVLSADFEGEVEITYRPEGILVALSAPVDTLGAITH